MPEDDVFQPFVLPNRPTGVSFALSVGVHLVGVLVILSWRYIGPLERLNYTPRNYEVQIIRYSLPEPLLLAAAGRSGERARLQAPPQAGAPGKGPARRPGSKGAPAPGPRGPAGPEGPAPEVAEAPPTPKRKFELPQLPRQQAAKRGDVIIQPEFAPDVQVVGKANLPNVFLWSERVLRPPERQLKTFVPGQPPRAARPKPQALPDAAPQVQLPNQQQFVSDLQIGPMAAPPERPKLPVFQATTTPIRLPRRTLEAPSELPATPLPPGEGANLLAIMERPAPPAASYHVAAGNRLAGDAASGAGLGGGEAASPAAPAAGGGGATGGEGPAGPGTTGSGASGSSGAGNTNGSSGASSASAAGRPGGGAGSGSGSGAGAAGTGAGTSTSAGSAGRGGSAAGNGAGSGGARAGAGSGNRPGGRGLDLGVPGLTINGGRVAPRSESPNATTFDLVVVNLNTRELLPESPGVLTGQPVYTVYMPVPGSRREWILQFAIPNSRPPVEQKSVNSVKLGAIAPVRAPFPLRKANLSLQELSNLPSQVRVVVYALITDQGALQGARVIRSVRSDVDTAVLACLREFAFRPATRDGRPVGVEALFGVPVN